MNGRGQRPDQCVRQRMGERPAPSVSRRRAAIGYSLRGGHRGRNAWRAVRPCPTGCSAAGVRIAADAVEARRRSLTKHQYHEDDDDEGAGNVAPKNLRRRIEHAQACAEADR
jgi:hypothetical protein